MNAQVKEINQIIAQCDVMIEYIKKNGIIHTGNAAYATYKERLKSFFDSHVEIKSKDYAPFAVLDCLYFNSTSYTVNLSEAQMMRDTVIKMKHELFANCYEKIFIGHCEKDGTQVNAFIDLLYAMGMHRPTKGGTEKAIFCTSHPATYIENGVRNLDEIKQQFQGHEHIFYILWYTDHYFESQACLNEAGAIWVTNKKYQEILAPGFDCNRIHGLLDKQPVWFRSNDKKRLNTFRDQFENMFNLPSLTTNSWEQARDDYIQRIEALTGGTIYAHS